MKAAFGNKNNRLKNNWALIWLIFVLCIASAFVVFAAYTGVNSVKRVASTRASSGQQFSSNCLKVSPTYQRLSSKVYTITVCNFDQNDPSNINPADITYTLTASLAVKTGNNTYTKLADYLADNDVTEEEKAVYTEALSDRTYSIQMTKDDESDGYTGSTINLVNETDYSKSISDNYTNLKGGVSSVDSYKITFDNSELDDTEPDFYIYVEAAPSSPPTLQTISNNLCAAKSSASAASWSGTLIESNCATVDYDFYNYVLTGSGVGTVDIMWNPEKFEPNEFFFSELSGNEFVLYDTSGEVTTDSSAGSKTKTISENGHTGWKMATLKVDSTEKSRYQIQLYKVMENESYTGSNIASNFIYYEYHAGAAS